MKRLLICGFLFFLCACSSKEKTIQIEVASSIENQIQAQENLRLDQIMLNVTYLDNSKQYIVLDETMIKTFDTNKIGIQSLTIEYLNVFLTIPFVIYDNDFLEHNYIYYYELNEGYKIVCVSTIQEVSIPWVDNQFFFGWYKDRIRKTVCMDDPNDRILEIYPLFVSREQYDNFVLINFMVDGRIDRSCYISKGGLIPYYSPDWEGFSCWDKNEKMAYESMDIYAIHKEENQIVVRFYQQDGRFDHYEIHEKGVCIDNFKGADISERLRFSGWNSSLKYLTKDADLYPIYDAYYHIVFQSTLSCVGILAEEWVIEGGTAYFNAEELGIEVLSYSKRLDDIHSDMTIDVETTNKERLLIYYQGMLISTTYDFYIPYMERSVG
ncbi:MAG: hypothetical protein K2J85_07975, partial [Anaeroplasmataceae bacterium]|nr:hypothetical protein [Anaeroplasmataceae bacterium]